MSHTDGSLAVCAVRVAGSIPRGSLFCDTPPMLVSFGTTTFALVVGVSAVGGSDGETTSLLGAILSRYSEVFFDEKSITAPSTTAHSVNDGKKITRSASCTSSSACAASFAAAAS